MPDRHFILLACLCSWLICARTKQSVHTQNSAQLLAALQSNDVDTIVLDADVALGPEFEQYQGEAPLPINRNVTITHNSSVSGSLDNTDALPVIDLMHKNGIIQLCSSCTFRFLWVNIAHENSVGTGLGMSTFRGVPGSRLERVGGAGLRVACPATGPTLTILNSTRRSALFPSNNGQQVSSSTDYVFRGKLYQNMLSIGDISSDLPLQQLTDFSFIGGYAIHRANATRLCDHIISAQCLMQKTPEECIALLLAGNSSMEASTGGNQEIRVVAIAVPVAVAGVSLLAAAAAAFVVLRKRRHKRASLQSANSKPLDGSSVIACEPDVEAVSAQAMLAAASPSSLKRQPTSSSTVSTPQLTSSQGPWQLLWSGMAPHMAAAQDNAIELGALLGAGSFARVFKARWAGLDVAVKVIQHYSSSAWDVANEVQLMLNINHPHVVRAYHCITKQLASEEQLQEAAQQQAASGPGLPATTGTATAPNSVQSLRAQHSSGTAVLLMAGNNSSSTGTGVSSSSHSTSHAPRPASARQQQQQQNAAALAGCSLGSLVQDLDPPRPAAAAPAAAPAAVGSSRAGSAASSSTSSSIAWPVIAANGPAPLLLATGSLASTEDDNGGGGGGGGSGSGRDLRLRGEGAGALCETWLVTEFCDRGTLARQASELQPQVNEQDMLRLLQLLRDVACGLTLLHSHNIVHADLNAHNVLIASSPVAPYGLVAKIADLGLSRVLKQHATHRTTRTVGMLTHQPPELLKDGRTSPAVDIYSFGIMMHEVFTRQAAFGCLRYGQIYHQVVILNTRPPVPPDMPDDYELLMCRCWSVEPSQRPSIDMLLACLDIMIETRQNQESSSQSSGGPPQQLTTGGSSQALPSH